MTGRGVGDSRIVGLGRRLTRPAAPQKTKARRKNPRAFVASIQSGSASSFLHHAAHTAHAVVMAAHAAGCFFLLFRQIGHGHLGGEHQPRDARGVL